MFQNIGRSTFQSEFSGDIHLELPTSALGVSVAIQVSISRAGVILVFVPLIIVLLFVFALTTLLAQADAEAARAFRAAQISNSSNKLVRDIFEVGSLTRGELSQFSSDQCTGIIRSIRTDLDQLREAVKGDPEQQDIVQRSGEAGEEAYLMLEQMQNTLKSGNALGAMNQWNLTRGSLRSCLKRMVSHDLIAMAQTEKERAESSHKAQAKFRKHMQLLSITGAILIIVFTLFAALMFRSVIVQRLKILVDNSFRLASSRPLNPPLSGHDEISNVDRSFHDMADALSQAEQREKAMIENSLDVICSLDPSGRFATVNPACSQMLGVSESDLLGRTVGEFVYKDDLESVIQALNSARTGQSEIKFESRMKHKDGKLIDAIWSVHWVPAKSLLFCVIHDISERKAAERMRQEVIAMVSHDLRTPIATVRNYLEMLDEGLFGNISERGNHLLKVAESNLGRMANLSNDLLDLEKCKAGMLELSCEAVNLNEALEQCVKSVSSLALRQQIKLDLRKTDLTVWADSNRIAQVLVNLLSNAIKYSPKDGYVKIETRQEANMAIVCIADQGRGIPDHLKETIFERFHQVEIADAVDKGGSGLGLAICKAIVEAHGGKIRVENNADCGSVFSFSLPCVGAGQAVSIYDSESIKNA